jgi:cytochrome c peroxidase
MGNEREPLCSRAGWRTTKSSSAALFIAALASGAHGCSGAASGSDNVRSTTARLDGQLENNFPFANEGGAAATFSTAGFVNLDNEFHTPQGTNGRSCGTCHLPELGWSINPSQVETLFAETAGTAPIFNPLDANSASADVSTPEARYASYSMLRGGLFRRGANLPAAAEYTIIAVDDPLGAGGSTTRFEFFRRPLATANFHLALNVGWHSQNGQSATPPPTPGLVAQAAGNITGAQQGTPPASPEVVNAIVAYESQLSFAQLVAHGAGRLDACGGRGGPELLASQAFVNARFDLFDAWGGAPPGQPGSDAGRQCLMPGCSVNPHRQRIARGQILFNAVNPGGGSCRGCHNAANNGSNVSGALFDIGASDADKREPGMPLYTLMRTSPVEIKQTTDPGRAAAGAGTWATLNRFKVPSLRGVAARAPYFHNGIAKTLLDVVRHYEEKLGFVFTVEEEQDLVAFMNAL